MLQSANGHSVRKKSRLLAFRSTEGDAEASTLPRRSNTQSHSKSSSTSSSLSTSRRRDSSISSLTDIRSSIRRRSASFRSSSRGFVSQPKDTLAFTADSRSASSTSLKPSLSVATHAQRSAENLAASALPPSSSPADGRPPHDLVLRRVDSGRPPATSHGIVGRERGASTTTFSSTLTPAPSGGAGGGAANATAGLDNQRIPEVCNKRINTMEYLRKTHEGRVYWFNTLLFEKSDFSRMPYFDEAKLSRRATNYLLLGLSLPYQLDPHGKNPVEFVRAFNALLAEFETYQTAHPPEGGASSSLARVRMGQMFKRAASGTGSKRRGSGAEAFAMGADNELRSIGSGGSGGGSSYGSLPGTRDELLPGEEYSMLLTPSLPFEPDYFETFATLCDVLIDCYTKIIALLQSFEADPQSAAEIGVQFAKADSKVRKILMAGIIRDYEDTSKQGIRSELAGVGKVVLGGLM